MLGRSVAEELYRRGIRTTVLLGDAKYHPRVASRVIPTPENHLMLDQLKSLSETENFAAALFLASVCDYLPSNRKTGKIRSDESQLRIDLQRAEKIIDSAIHVPIRIGMKLEIDDEAKNWLQIANAYLLKKRLDLLLVNRLCEVDEVQHRATAYHQPDSGEVCELVTLGSKMEIARFFSSFIQSKLRAIGVTSQP